MALLKRTGRRRRPALLAFLAFASLAAGCSDRPRDNPLDPRNPGTSGGPTGFAAVALSGQVLLSWNRTGDLSTRVFRRAEHESQFRPITDLLAPRNTLFTDLVASNDVTYHYRLHFANASGTIGPAATAVATPSRVVAWVADARRGSLLRLAADGREIAFEEPGLGLPSYLAVDRARDLVWVADEQFARVVIYVASLGVRINVPGFQAPGVIAVDPGDGSAWISDWRAGNVRHVLAGGGSGTPSEIGALDEPAGVDVEPQTRSLWVCERRGGRVRRYSSAGAPLGSATMPFPSRVAADSANGEAWVTSFETGRLVHFATDFTVLHTVTSLRGPIGVAVDPRRGRVWVADPVAGQLVAFRRDGSEELRVNGLAGARDVAVELASGEAWVTVNGSIARVSPTGAVLATTRGLGAPVAVGLDRLAP